MTDDKSTTCKKHPYVVFVYCIMCDKDVCEICHSANATSKEHEIAISKCMTIPMKLKTGGK